MRRFVALVLASAVAVSSAAVSRLHVHEYVGHDHPDHHHGPAIHEHEHSPSLEPGHHTAEADHQPGIDAESCDPGHHAVSVTTACAYTQYAHADLAELPGPAVFAPSGPMRSALPITDVRVHGPPFDPRIPSRAPPVFPHA